MTFTKLEWGLLAGFMLLNVIDLVLMHRAIQLGSRELNPIMNLANTWTLKSLFTACVVYFLMLFRKVRFLKWVNVGLGVIVIYNSVAVWTWS